jgi:hypothetical protein
MTRVKVRDAGPDAVREALRDAVPRPDLRTVEVSAEDATGLVVGAADTLVLTTPLEVLPDALNTLRTLRRALPPSGALVCAVGNFASAATVVQLLRSDPHRAAAGVVAPEARDVHGYATALKLLLEAGLSPDIATVVKDPAPDGFLEAASELLARVRVDPARAATHLAATHYVLVATPIEGVDDAPDDRPITFAACVNDDAQLHHNLLASPVFGPGSHHELLLFRGMDSAAQGLNQAIRQASHELVVLVQQDIYLPAWWPGRLVAQWRAASADGAPAIGGPFGLLYREGGRTHVGHAVDRDELLHTGHDLPLDVDGLDELVLVVEREEPLRFDPAFGWHLYGTDFVLQARAAGRRAVVLDVPVHHNSLYSVPDDAYHHAEAVLAAKWPRELPILTNTSTIDRDPRDERIAALEARLDDTERALIKAKRGRRKRQAELDRIRSSRSWRWGRRLARLSGRR